jgi:Bax protein
MKKISLIVFISIAFSSFGQHKYFVDYRKLADSLESVYQIPACVILSIAYIESGGGTSSVAKKLHNHFGITGKNDVSISNYKSVYRYFPTIRDSYIGFCNLVVSKKYYASMKGSKDNLKWLKTIASYGYAADANGWSNSIYNTLKKNCQ